MAEILDIVNEVDEVIGQADRDVVHAEGLWCRMVFVLFYTPDKKIILQRRSMTKKSNPGKLTTTVSGHVSSGSSYEQTAIKETLEETGIAVDPSKLTLVGKVFKGFTEDDYVSNAFRAMYVYPYDGAIEDIKVEAGDGAGFEVITTEEFWKQLDIDRNVYSFFLRDELGEKMIEFVEQSS